MSFRASKGGWDERGGEQRTGRGKLTASPAPGWHWDPEFIRVRPEDVESNFASERAREGEQTLLREASSLEPPARGPAVALIRGGSSDVVSLDAVEELRAACPHLHFYDVLDTSHMVAGDSNARFNSALLSFLAKEVDGGGGGGAPRAEAPRSARL